MTIMRMPSLAKSGLSLLLALALTASALVAAVVASVATASPASAAPTDPTNYKVTLAARVCTDQSLGGPSWPNVRANRARNNIQESLKNLGPDTNYTSNMVPPVDPDKEEAVIGGQAACDPLVGQPITFGSQINGKAPAPVNGSSNPYLSKVGGNVTGVNATNDTTTSVPRLNNQGQPVGSETIAGAVTVTLNEAQLAQAQKNALWTMGGTTADALPTNDTFSSGGYSFAALRCNTDALNGDNVEFIGYRSGQTHVFCYAWYIGDPGPPPPTPGTITLKKSAPAAPNQSFGFQGDVSFTQDGKFPMRDSVAHPGDVFSETRSPGLWNITETTLPSGWNLQSIICTQDSGSSVVTNLGTRSAAMTLGEGGNITCTFNNALAPPPDSNLRIAKVTFGSTGTFPFELTGPTGGGTTSLTTTNDQGQDPDSHLFSGITSGAYTMTETLPATTVDGYWDVTSVVCIDDTGAEVPNTGSGTTRTIQVSVVAADVPEITCTWANTFTATASLEIRAKTIGGDNTAINYLTGALNPDTGECDVLPYSPFFYDQNADTTGGPGFHVAVPAADTEDQPLQTYCIGGTRPTEGADPSWVTKSIVCSPEDAIDPNAPFITTPDVAFAMVRPLAGQKVTCDFTYVKRSTLTLTKDVLGGNDLRDRPVVVELNCTTSSLDDPDNWPKIVTVPIDETTGELADIYVDGDIDGNDTCQGEETDNGAKDPTAQATINPFWNGAVWPAGSGKTLKFEKVASLAGTTATNDSSVTTNVTSGPCILNGVDLTAASGTGTCDLKFTAAGNPGVVTTTTAWSATNAAVEGEGNLTAALPIAAGEDRAIAFTDSYTQAAMTITTNRTVALTKDRQAIDCSINPNQFKCKQTRAGQPIKWRAFCKPFKQNAVRGDLFYCKVKVFKNGRVKITNVRGLPVLITLTGKAKATANYAAWTKTWQWKVKKNGKTKRVS